MTPNIGLAASRSTRDGDLYGRVERTSRTESVLPTLAALLDVSVMVSYAIGISAPNWHIGVLTVKFALILLFARRLKVSIRSIVFVAVAIVSIAPGMLMSSLTGDAAIKLFAFCAQLIITGALIGSGGLSRYLKTAAVAIAASASAHVLMCYINVIPNHYGRYLYFGGSHPNLGSEIGAIGLLSAALTMRWRSLILVLVPIVLGILLMQGRSALLAVMFLISIRLVFLSLEKAKSSQAVALGIASTLLFCVAVFMITISQIASVANDVFMLDDSYRGLGTGFVGRDERWRISTLIFESSPIFGVGQDYFEYRGIPSPHNFFFYAITTMGAIGSFLFLGCIVYLLGIVYRSDFKSAIVLIGVLPLLILNDRLINLNPYPFFVYVILITFPLARSEISTRFPMPRFPRIDNSRAIK